MRRYIKNHEKVHRFFTPGAGIPSTELSKITRIRQILGWNSYHKFKVIKYGEEAIAQGYAIYIRTGSIQKAIVIGAKFPIRNGYVTLGQVFKEGSTITVVFSGLLYGAFETGQAFFDD